MELIMTNKTREAKLIFKGLTTSPPQKTGFTKIN